MNRTPLPEFTAERLILHDVNHGNIFYQKYFANTIRNLKSRRIKTKTGAQLKYVKALMFVISNFSQSEIGKLKKSEWFADLAAKGRK